MSTSAPPTSPMSLSIEGGGHFVTPNSLSSISPIPMDLVTRGVPDATHFDNQLAKDKIGRGVDAFKERGAQRNEAQQRRRMPMDGYFLPPKFIDRRKQAPRTPPNMRSQSQIQISPTADRNFPSPNLLPEAKRSRAILRSASGSFQYTPPDELSQANQGFFPQPLTPGRRDDTLADLSGLTSDSVNLL